MRWLLALLVAACASAEPLDPSTMDDATFEREIAALADNGHTSIGENAFKKNNRPPHLQRACTDRATCFWLNDRYPVRVRTLEPDIAAPLTFSAYRDLHDPALDAVLVREARRRSSAHTR